MNQVQALLPDGGTVVRYGGADRFATSATIANATWPSGASTVIFASGFGFADALAGVPAAAVNDAPLLLAGGKCLSSDVTAMTNSFAPVRTLILGGTGALPTTSTMPCADKGSAGRAVGAGREGARTDHRLRPRPVRTGLVRHRPQRLRHPQRHPAARPDRHRHQDDTDGCVVASGTLADPYTATTIFFVRGPESGDVQIDHVVALSDAWQKGAQQWTADTLKAFANDPLNLLAVDGPTNASKGDGDAATWLPPNKAYRCDYVARQIAVKAKYKAWVTAAENDAMASVLSGCPGQTLPTNVSVPPPVGSPTPPATDAYYANCDAVRAAGAAPLYAGQPGYRAGLDRDGDGVACEA